MSNSDWLTVIAILILVVTSAFFAMSETALVRMNRIRAMTLDEEGRRGAKRLVGLLEEPENTLNLILLFVLICQLTAGTLVGVLVEGQFGAYGVLIGTVVEVSSAVTTIDMPARVWATSAAPASSASSRAAFRAPNRLFSKA